MSDDRPVFVRLLSLAYPIIGLNVLNVLALTVDTAMLGRLETAETALTGLGFAVQLIFLLMVAMIGLTVGTVAIVSRAHGADHPERVAHVVLQSAQLTVLVGLFVAVFGNAIAPTLLELLGATGAERAAGLAYLRPMLGGCVFTYLNILFAGILRGVGDTQIPFRIALVSNAVNVVLNYGLILGNLGLPALGIFGAAMGTVISQALAVALLVWTLRSNRIPHLHLKLRPERIDLELARQLFRVGSPASLDMLVLNAGFLSIVGMLGRWDPLAVAAHGIGLRVQALAFVPGMSVSQATGAMVGNALGGEDVEEARRVLWASVWLCAAIMGTLAAVIVGLAAPIVSLFEVDPSTAMGSYSVLWMQLLGLCMPFVGVYIAFVGLFQGSGATRTSLRINSLVTLLFQIPASWALGFPLGMGPFGIWVAFPLSFVLKAVLAVGYYYRGDWAKTGEQVE